MNQIAQIIIATLSISIIALIGIFALSMKDKLVQKILLWLVGLSSGALMGGAFIHLLPEAVEKSEGLEINIFNIALISFVIFFLVEKILHWRHCHKNHCPVHTFGTMNLIGDAIHNFIDGLIIAASFMADVNLGIVTTIALALHEIPQEIGDYGVLIYAGYSKTKALLYNFIVALTVVVGGIVGYFISESIDDSIVYLLPFAAGGFIYIAASDLMPEIRKEKSFSKSASAILFFVAGISIMYLAKILGE